MNKTIDFIKKKRSVPERVRNNIKATNKLNKLIVKVLESGQKTIPELAAEIKVQSDLLTYTIMTLQKYDIIEAGEMDDNDEYFYYKLKKRK